MKGVINHVLYEVMTLTSKHAYKHILINSRDVDDFGNTCQHESKEKFRHLKLLASVQAGIDFISLHPNSAVISKLQCLD